MSRRHFITPDGSTVTAGWDRPLHSYFLDVVRSSPVLVDALPEDEYPDEDIDYIFDSNLGSGVYYSLDEVEADLKKLRIDIPEGFLDDLRRDKTGGLAQSYVDRYYGLQESAVQPDATPQPETPPADAG